MEDTKDTTSVESPPRRIPRREFIKGVVALGAVSLIPDLRNKEEVITRKPHPSSKEGSNIDDIDSKKVPEKLPEDILSEEELKKRHIKINNSPSTKLYLRKEALKFPIFRDAQRIDEVVITLVDSPTVSWNSAEKMPEEEKIVFRKSYNPDSDRKEIEDRIRYYQERIDALEKEKTRALEKKHPYLINTYEGLIEEAQKAYDEVLEVGGPLGIFIDRRKLVGGKIYIFLAVGGRQKPNPKHSYMDPYGGYPPNEEAPFVLPAGYVIRHELSHYGHPDESEADILAANSLVDALEKYKKNGDSSGYAFVFVNDRGITITKKKDQAVGA